MAQKGRTDRYGSNAIMTYSAHGHGPYLIAAGVGREIGPVIINHFPRYGNVQLEILKKRYGKDPNIFMDRGSGEILSQIDFFGDYRDFIRRNNRYGERVRKELADHLRSFEAVSLAGEKRLFKSPKLSISAGARFVPFPEKTCYVYPALMSTIAKYSPFEIDGIDKFVEALEVEESCYERIFIPEINPFSYTSIKRLKREISVPPLSHMLENYENIPKSIYYNISGATDRQNEEIIRAVKKTDLQIYKATEAIGPGIPAHPSIVFNKNCIAQLARAGWGTLWMGQLAEKPIIAPPFKENDDPEIYYNIKTVEKFGLGVIFDKLTAKIIADALTKVDRIKRLNRKLLKKFGTLDGLSYVANQIRERENVW